MSKLEYWSLWIGGGLLCLALYLVSILDKIILGR